MSQLQITNAGIDYRNAVFAGEEVQNITHFVFANKQGQDASAPIDPNTAIPANVLHTQPVKAVSKVDGNAIVISAVLGYDIGDFEYNWYGVVATKANNEQVLIAVVTTETQTKTKTVGAVTGNYSVKSIVWRSQNIADDLNITLAVLPWQVQEEELVSKAVFDAALNGKLNKTATAADSSKLAGQSADYYKDIVSRLGYSPIQQGGGANQEYNKIYIGWGGSVSKGLLLQIDDTNFGRYWPINASDSEKFGGLDVSKFLKLTESIQYSKHFQIEVQKSNINSQDGSARTLEVYQSDANKDAFMTFHIQGLHACYFGLDRVSKDLCVGGWSLGANSYRLWTEKNHGEGSGLDADLLDGKHGSEYAKSSDVQTPVPAGALFTDTQRSISDSLSSTSNSVSASSNALRITYNAAVAAQQAANAAQTTLNERLPKAAVKHYYTTGNVTVNFNDAQKHVITRFGYVDCTITLTGTLTAGDELVIENVRDDSGVATITGRTMYTGEGAESDTTHTLTGQAKLTMRAFNSSGLMVTEVD